MGFALAGSKRCKWDEFPRNRSSCLCGIFFFFFIDFFAHRSHSTRLNGITSELLDISASIIQGLVVGPASYVASYVVNAADLTTVTVGNVIFKYADDMYLVIPASNVSSRATELDHVDQWAERNNLRLNRPKSAEIIFTDGMHMRKLIDNLPPPILDIHRVTFIRFSALLSQTT